MANRTSRISGQQIARFRLRRHHLLHEKPADLVTICRDVCGVQAQIMQPAYLQLWGRNHALSRADIQGAIWKEKTLVKTSLMRQTLHLVSTNEFALYIAALRDVRVAQALRVMARCGVNRDEGEALTPLIMEALARQPLGRKAIADAVRPKVSKRVRRFMELSWSMIRVPVAQGLVCYGAGEGNEVVFSRVDRWLPEMKVNPIDAATAQRELFLKYLRAYGPATLRDFAHWSGISMQEVKRLQAMVGAEVVEVDVEGGTWLLMRDDLPALRSERETKPCIRLLPHFDVYLLAHRDKQHLLSAAHYKRVYRNQGWISPVVLVDGEILGVWSYKAEKNKVIISVDAFGKLSKPVRAGIEQEAEGVAKFLGGALQLRRG